MTDKAWVPFTAETAFYRVTREERHFCAVLTHLLMQGSDAVRILLEQIEEQLQAVHLPSLGDIESFPVDEAQIYFEPAILRDIWSTLGADPTEPLTVRNARRRAFIFDLGCPGFGGGGKLTSRSCACRR
jgi:hypothetical protein